MAIQSVNRAIQILFAFTVEEPLLGISDLSRKLGINQSTVHHLVQSLISSELIEQELNSKKYRLGLRTIELGGRMLRSRNLSVVVQQYLHHVADRLEETTYLGVLVNGELLNLEQVCGPHLVQHCGWQGRRTPFHCTSAGKALAAFLPGVELDRLIKGKGLPALTANTITDVEVLKQELEKVIEDGYALNIGELEDQNNAVAVPIKGPGKNQAVAALGVVGPAYRFTEMKCREAVPYLKSVAVEISGLLYSGGSWVQISPESSKSANHVERM